MVGFGGALRGRGAPPAHGIVQPVLVAIAVSVGVSVDVHRDGAIGGDLEAVDVVAAAQI